MTAWYEDPTRQIYTTTYEGDQELNQEIIAAFDHGWLPERADRIRRHHRHQRDGIYGSAWSVTWVRKNPT